MKPLRVNSTEMRNALKSMLKLSKDIGSDGGCHGANFLFMLSEKTCQFCIAPGVYSCRYILTREGDVERVIANEDVCFFSLPFDVIPRIIDQLEPIHHRYIELDAQFVDASRTVVEKFWVDKTYYHTLQTDVMRPKQVFLRLHDMCKEFSPGHFYLKLAWMENPKKSKDYWIGLKNLRDAIKRKYALKNADLDRKQGSVAFSCGRKGLFVREVKLAYPYTEEKKVLRSSGKLAVEKTKKYDMREPLRLDTDGELSFLEHSGLTGINEGENLPLPLMLNVQFLTSILKAVAPAYRNRKDTNGQILLQMTDPYEPVHIRQGSWSVLLMGLMPPPAYSKPAK
jgi:hypothetical protein